MKEIFNEAFTLYVTGKNGNRVLNWDEREPILREFLALFEVGYDMPAFGVSLHDLTFADMKEHRHLIFEFETPGTYDEYPFEALAVRVEPESTGFHLLRRFDGRWDGRCLYWQTEKNMERLSSELDRWEAKL